MTSAEHHPESAGHFDPWPLLVPAGRSRRDARYLVGVQVVRTGGRSQVSAQVDSAAASHSGFFSTSRIVFASVASTNGTCAMQLGPRDIGEVNERIGLKVVPVPWPGGGGACRFGGARSDRTGVDGEGDGPVDLFQPEFHPAQDVLSSLAQPLVSKMKTHSVFTNSLCKRISDGRSRWLPLPHLHGERHA